MKRPISQTFLLIIVVLLLISPAVWGQDHDGNDDDDHGNHDSCHSDPCLQCDQTQSYCVDCDWGYYLNVHTGYCDDRRATRDRGDSMSKAVGVINIIFIIVLVHTWLYLSRNNTRRFIKTSGNNSDQRINLNGGAQQQQQPGFSQQPNIGLIRVGAPSEGGSSNDLRSRFSSVSQSPQPLADFEKPQAKNMLEQPGAIDQPIQAVAYPINLQQQQQQQAYPASIQMGIPLGQNYPIVQQSQQPTQQLSQGPQLVSRDLNGYWLTQAGKFSFVGFSNFHRVKHMVLNIMMLEQVMAMLLYESGRRGDDNDEDNRKKLLFLAFSLVLVIYWVYTLLPPLVIKIFSCCLCLKTDPWGRVSTIFINFLFYFFSIIIVVSLTSMLFKLDGFESQVWILLVLAAFLLIVFFDKKSIEIAKKYKGGYLEELIKFRKMDFLVPTIQEQRQQQQQQDQQQQMHVAEV